MTSYSDRLYDIWRVYQFTTKLRRHKDVSLLSGVLLCALGLWPLGIVRCFFFFANVLCSTSLTAGTAKQITMWSLVRMWRFRKIFLWLFWKTKYTLMHWGMGIISKTSCNLTNMSYRLQNTYWIRMSSVKFPYRCLWMLKIDLSKLSLKKWSFNFQKLYFRT